jgi:hypothetical protein
MCAAYIFGQRPNFLVDLAEIICQKLATLVFMVISDARAPLSRSLSSKEAVV